ncbi:PREDICTED: uncharacterized protein LOC108749132 [Trachymyrmex septentrionalis]|uniref:uncharacterized protein LOC108749132 n=1 Tax=Trachymyrmex septentrionalis TaxID=34720 RepID=UPI00084EE364|nr:PREDICTED: uncharacterized protein LOC108749132 [Trachymyrmex septentrionalis]
MGGRLSPYHHSIASMENQKKIKNRTSIILEILHAEISTFIRDKWKRDVPFKAHIVNSKIDIYIWFRSQRRHKNAKASPTIIVAIETSSKKGEQQSAEILPRGH